MLVLYYIITVILTEELVMATTEECGVYRFKSPFYPGESCENIYSKNLESHEWSGYYWITDGPSRVFCGMAYAGSSCEDIYNNNPETGDKSGYYRINNDQWTYCNMTAIAAGIFSSCAGVRGEWRRIAKIDISTGDNCPSGWRTDTHSGVSFCRVVSDSRFACSSSYFSTNGTSYQRVCGKARGYQKGEVLGFHWSHAGQTIDGYYADGLLITYNSSPRQHIWTFTSGRFDNRSDCCNCYCAAYPGYSPPSYVGTDYYCESGTYNSLSVSGYYFDDPLWDGSGCIASSCCNNPTQPWFYQELSETTASDIEARICGNYPFHNGSPLIDQLELYIQ